MTTAKILKNKVITSLDDSKAVDIVALNVKELTTITDYMIICSGNSNRHVHAIASSLVEAAKHDKTPPLSVTGDDHGEWIIVDLNDVVVHIMLPATREFYNLEKLWQTGEVKKMLPERNIDE